MRVWLIRHGMTRLGEEKRYQGALDEGLSDTGRAALRRADNSPALVHVSPLLRARETASVLFPAAGQIVVPDLREMDFGVFEGRGWWEMEQDASYRAWVDGGCVGRCPGGEDRAEYTARVCAAVGKLLQTEAEKFIIVAHGGTQMAVLDRWGDPAREYWQWQRPCGCGWLLEYDKTQDCMTILREVSFLK